MTNLASFFGRIKRTTEISKTYAITIPPAPLGAGTIDPSTDEINNSHIGQATVNSKIIVAPANISRTIITLTNNSTTDELRYGYDDTLADGQFHILRPGDSIDLEDPNVIYVVPLGGNPVELNIDEGEG